MSKIVQRTQIKKQIIKEQEFKRDDYRGGGDN